MPLHTVGVRLPGAHFGITRSDVISVVAAILFYWQPGVNPKGVMQWVVDNFFFGSIAFCSIFGTFFSHKLFEWGGMCFYAFLYRLEGLRKSRSWSWLGHRIHSAKLDPDEPWAWDNENKKVGEQYDALAKKSIFYILKYHAIVSIVQFLIFTTAIQWKWVGWSKGGVEWSWITGNPEFDRADPELIPSKATVAFQCLVGTFIAETGFYFAHWMMHVTPLYYWHKRHHEYKDSTVWATFYVGLLDSILTDFIPAGFPIVYFRMHQWTIWMFTLPLILNAMRVHCGYNNDKLSQVLGFGFNPSVTLPMATDSERTHDMHHRYNNCNYGGAIFLWDRIMGTWADPDQEFKQLKKNSKFQSASAAVAPAMDGESSNNKKDM